MKYLSKQKQLNRYSGPREQCAWPNCDKQDDTFPVTRIGVLCYWHARSAAEAYNELIMHDFTDYQAQAVYAAADAEREERAKQQRLREQRGRQPGWVYYMRVGDRVKIGYSVDVKRRMQSYPPESRLLAVHPGTKKLESEMHQLFAKSLIAGREWFKETPDLTEHIRQVCAQFGAPNAHTHWFRVNRETQARSA